MKLNELEHVLRVCIAADVVPALIGHAGIGKTERVLDTAATWVDYWTGKKGLPSMALYCATQDVADLIGYPITIWKKSKNPVVKGIKEDGPLCTAWAPPDWLTDLEPIDKEIRDAEDREFMKKMKADGATQAELDAFWNRPSCILFLDELRRAPREVIQCMYPALTQHRIHTHVFPRGTRIVTADNPIGAYDTRDTDHAFLSRLCEIQVDPDPGAWMIWAVEHDINPKIRDFISSNPRYLHELPEGLEANVAKHNILPDPRKWTAVHRIETLAQYGLKDYSSDRIAHYKRVCITGIVGQAVGGSYSEFTVSTISLLDILKGKATIKPVLDSLPNLVDKNKLREKMLIEFAPVMKGRDFDKKEAANLQQFFLEFDAGDKVVAMFQELFSMADNKQITGKWTAALLAHADVFKLFELFRNPAAKK